MAEKPPAPETTTSVSYLGVPDDYSVTQPLLPRVMDRPDERQPLVFAPRYSTGDEMTRLRDLSPESLVRLQTQLAQAGLIGPRTKFRVGMADSTTVNAYRQLLTLANRYATSDADMLAQLRNHPVAYGDGTSSGGSGSSGGPSTTRTGATFTDPATARATVRQAMQDRLGRDPTDKEFAAFRKALHGNDAKSGTETTTTYDSAGIPTSTTTGGAQDSATPSVVADEFTRKGKLGKEANTKMAAVDYYAAAMAKLGPGGT